MSKKIMIFKAGKYPQGDVSKLELEKLAEAYNKGTYSKAPFVISHRSRWDQDSDADEFAYGWVGKLSVSGNALYAEDCEFSDELKSWVVGGKLRYMSVELQRFNRLEDPKPMALARVALLGRSTPAVKGAKINPAMMFSAACGKDIQEGTDESAFLTQKINFDFEEEESLGGHDMTKKDGNLSFEEQEALKTKNSELEKQLAEFQNKEAEAQRIAFYEKLKSEGKISPAQYEQMLEADRALDGDAQISFRKSFQSLPKIVHFDAKAVKGESSEMGDYMQQIQDYAQEHSLGFEAAAKAVYAKNPDAFDDKNE